MVERTAVLVTGSRDWKDRRAIYERLRIYPRGAVVLHGACRGADDIAVECAIKLGLNDWGLPYFADLGKRGGPERNACLVLLLETLHRSGFRAFVEAFPIGASPGTRGCVKLARAANESLKVHTGTDAFSICVTEVPNV